MNARSVPAFVFFLCATLWAPPLAAQPAVKRETGRIEGRVRDALDRPIAGAAVRLETESGAVAAEAKTGSDGRFVFTDVAAGVYAVEVSKEGFEQGVSIVTATAGGSAAPELVLASTRPLDVTVAAKKLNEARNQILTRTGSSRYTIHQEAIQAQPGGSSAPLNQTLLRAPGVAQDSFGQVHVRGDHANLQYRLNGIQLPEGVSGFGQVLGSRFIDQTDLLDGALPAQYGLRTAGIVDIQTKTGTQASGTTLDVYGGSHDQIQPSFQVGGTSGSLSYYADGEFLHDALGVENPTPSLNAIHDATNQGRGFAYLSGLLDPTSRVSFIGGAYGGRYQIPNNPGQTPAFMLLGVPGFDSKSLDETQDQQDYFGALAYQKSLDRLDFQLELFSRYSRTDFDPDPLGDLIFNGVAGKITQDVIGNGLQGDSAYRLTDTHTLRAGLLYVNEYTTRRSAVNVFHTDPLGDQTPDHVPFTIHDNGYKVGNSYSLYLQDEWKILDELTVNYGLRFDAVDAFVAANQLSPRVNVVYKPCSGTALHAGYARYFTPPPQELVATTSVAKFQGTTNASELPFGSPVKVERSHYFDAGVTQQILPGLQVGLDGYYKLSTHLIDEGQFGQALILNPFNYKKGRIYGAELTASYQVGGFTTYANVAYSVAQGKAIESAQFLFEQDELDYIANHYVYLDHDQRWTTSLGASYLWNDTRFSVDALLGSGLRSGFANTDKLPSYEQVNLGLSHKFALGDKASATLRFDIINLFDQVYAIRSGEGIGVGAPQYGPRRTYYGGVSVDF
jgi:outer membrane cobalamin receptor